VNNLDAVVKSVQPVPDHLGVYAIRLQSFRSELFGDPIPIQVRVTTSNGEVFSSNTINLAKANSDKQ